jgi:acetyl-CoA acetyltransferase family protein
VHQGESAELIADRWQLGREEMDAFAARSHQSAAKAIAGGRFVAEMVPMTLDCQLRHADQCVRPETTVETLANLRPVFRKEGGRITAGSSSPISDGAAAVLLCSDDAARRLGLRTRAQVVDQTTVGVDPIIMLTGPIPATRKLLQRNNLRVDDIDLFEVNEAFSSVVLAWQRELLADTERVNVNGGAIALGHAVGATGARLLATLVAELERREADLGLMTMCCGGGLGTGTLIQRVPT